MSVPAQQPAPDALTSAESPDTSWGTSPASAASPSAGRATDLQPSKAHPPGRASYERIARVAAVILLAIVCVAVVWPSGREVAELKDAVGPAFLSSEGKDVVLNLVMLAPATFCAVAGWRDIPWWMWALVGCVVGLSAEVLQRLLRQRHKANVSSVDPDAPSDLFHRATRRLLSNRHARPARSDKRTGWRKARTMWPGPFRSVRGGGLEPP